jgi:hypothetical protein
MTYKDTDFLRAIARYCKLDAERITYMSFLTQYDIYNIGPIKIATKYMHAGKPLTRNRFYIGHKFIIHTEIPDIPELIGSHHIPPPVEDRIFKVWAKYHNEPTQKLRHIIRKKLKLAPIEKQEDYLGIDVNKYMKAEGFKIIKKEI